MALVSVFVKVHVCDVWTSSGCRVDLCYECVALLLVEVETFTEENPGPRYPKRKDFQAEISGIVLIFYHICLRKAFYHDPIV